MEYKRTQLGSYKGNAIVLYVLLLYLPQDEMEYKKTQLGNTAVTTERLDDELSQRRDELSKIDKLEDKIREELAGIAENVTKTQTQGKVRVRGDCKVILTLYLPFISQWSGALVWEWELV